MSRGAPGGTAAPRDPGAAGGTERRSWLPMVCIFGAQVLMSFNVAALPISLGGLVEEFQVPSTVASSTIVVYGLAVAALVMTGAKLGRRAGWVRTFRAAVALFGGAALLVVFSPTVTWAIVGQVLAGAAAALIVPALVALVAENYRGRQQEQAVGALGSARAVAGVAAFGIGGILGTVLGWRPAFVVVFVIAVAVFGLSFSLRGDRGDRTVRLDAVAAVLIALAVGLLSLGTNSLGAWGLLWAGQDAPFAVLGLSPAPLLVLAGVGLLQFCWWWTRRRGRAGRSVLIDPRVLGSAPERAATWAMFVVVGLEACLNFALPLYIQIVQDRSPLDTALAMIPFNLTVLVAAVVVVRFYQRFAPRTIGVFGFGLTTVGLVWLAVVVTNNWETVPTVLGLVVFGIGQGALVTLVFNVLVTAVPPDLTGDVGSLRGTTQNLATAVGTALAGALLVSLLGVSVARTVEAHPALPPELISQVDLTRVDFVSNTDLRAWLAATTTATPEQVEAAVTANEAARLAALRLSLLVLAVVSALAVGPASRLPAYRPGTIPVPRPDARQGSDGPGNEDDERSGTR